MITAPWKTEASSLAWKSLSRSQKIRWLMTRRHGAACSAITRSSRWKTAGFGKKPLLRRRIPWLSCKHKSSQTPRAAAANSQPKASCLRWGQSWKRRIWPASSMFIMTEPKSWSLSSTWLQSPRKRCVTASFWSGPTPLCLQEKSYRATKTWCWWRTLLKRSRIWSSYGPSFITMTTGCEPTCSSAYWPSCLNSGCRCCISDT